MRPERTELLEHLDVVPNTPTALPARKPDREFTGVSHAGPPRERTMTPNDLRLVRKLNDELGLARAQLQMATTDAKATKRFLWLAFDVAGVLLVVILLLVGWRIFEKITDKPKPELVPQVQPRYLQ